MTSAYLNNNFEVFGWPPLLVMKELRVWEILLLSMEWAMKLFLLHFYFGKIVACLGTLVECGRAKVEPATRMMSLFSDEVSQAS